MPEHATGADRSHLPESDDADPDRPLHRIRAA
jgi:hypothetical protein